MPMVLLICRAISNPMSFPFKILVNKYAKIFHIIFTILMVNVHDILSLPKIFIVGWKDSFFL